MKRLSLLLFVGVTQLQAFNIQLDYTHDTFFGSNPTAKAAIEAAAADVSGVLTSSLGAVTSDLFTGTNASTTVTFDWKLTYTNPTTGATVTLNTFTLPADTFTIYVGARLLAGSTLGQGGRGGVGLSAGVSGYASQLQGAVDSAEAASNAAMTRGVPVVSAALSGSVTLGATTAPYDLFVGPTIGNLWFDSDTDWHFDHTTSVASGKSDLYSVALHEILHTLGFGTGYEWDSLHAGTTWLGSNAIALNGSSGTGLLDAGEAHLVSGLMSTRLSDGFAQEAAMDPTLTVGTRKYLTAMDLAILQDLGYAVIPEPATPLLLLSAMIAGALRRRLR